MKALTVITDPVYNEPKEFSAYENFWLKYMLDKRDLPFIHLLTAIHILVIPVAVLLYTPVLQGWYWWLVYVPYFYISQMYFKGRFGLMLHCICHRKMFKKGYTWMFHYIIWVVCPFFGHTPETYFAHHMGMHHVENNMMDDASSTLPNQRDSFRGFLSYVGRFLILGFRDTFMYFFSRKRKKFYMRLTVGEMAFYLFCIGMSFVTTLCNDLFSLLSLMPSHPRPASDEVLRRDGRNLVTFQMIVSFLKFLIANSNLSHFVGGDGVPLQESGEARNKVAVRTLGQLVGRYVADVMVDAGVDLPESELPEKAIFGSRFSFVMESGRETLDSLRLDLKRMTEARNELVHGFLPRWKPQDEDAMKEGMAYLDEQREKVVPMFDHLRSNALQLLNSRPSMESYVTRPEFAREIELMWSHLSPLVQLFLQHRVDLPAPLVPLRLAELA